MLEEGDECCGHADCLLRADVNELNFRGFGCDEFATLADENKILIDLARLADRFAWSQNALDFFVCAQTNGLTGRLAGRDLSIRSEQESVIVDFSINTQAGDESDVRAFGRFNRADSAVMGNVDVAHFEACTLAIQSAWSQRRKASLVNEHGKRVGLINDLRQFASTEEEFDRT